MSKEMKEIRPEDFPEDVWDIYEQVLHALGQKDPNQFEIEVAAIEKAIVAARRK